MTILIVDDDREDSSLFCETLKELFPLSNCVVFENAESVLNYLRNTKVPPDFIFLDVYLTGMDGKECLLKIKSIKAIQKVPVIMYSGLDDSNQKAIYKKLGASEFVCKPSTVEALRNLLSSVVK